MSKKIATILVYTTKPIAKSNILISEQVIGNTSFSGTLYVMILYLNNKVLETSSFFLVKMLMALGHTEKWTVPITRAIKIPKRIDTKSL